MTPRPRPFHRSLLLWIGVPGLLFCIWAWVRSNSHQTTFVTQIPPNTYCVLMNAAGFLEYDFSSMDDGAIFMSNFEDSPLELKREWFPPAVVPARFSDDPFDTSNHFARVAWWFITLIYTLLWLTTCALWQHHKRKRQRQLLDQQEAAPSPP